MALFANKEFQQDLKMIEDNIKTLEKQYMDYFDNVISVEPKALRAQTEALIRKWWGKPISNAQLRFQIQNIVQRYNIYKEKWNRQLRLKSREEREA
ncbi:MAG: hypothetical protein RBT80_22540 [Candidatus Vecturithrix sp.]|jgi:hypothetical protein|nr:hypothetical protein [Candidatus Vecturithrix sp.]